VAKASKTMNASSKSFSGTSTTSADSEITAELPVLDVAAYEARHGHDPLSSTDTWASPTMNTALLPQLANLSDAVPEVMPSVTVSARIESELKSLAGNLAELETRLAAKGERLAIIEAELADSRVAGQAAATRAAALSEELATSRAEFTAATTEIDGLRSTLQEREDSIRVAAERETALRQSTERREAELRQSAEQRETELRQSAQKRESELLLSIERRETEMTSTLTRREAEMASTLAADAAKNTALIASHTSVLQGAQQYVAQLQTQSAAQLETLQSLEGRRGIFDSILRTLDIEIVGRDADKTRLADELARSTTHGLELTRQLENRTQRVTQLETEVSALTTGLGARTDEAAVVARANEELKRSLEGVRQESAGRAARVAELEGEVAALTKGLAGRTTEASALARTNEELKLSLEGARQESADRAKHITELEAQLVAGTQIHAEALRAAAAAHAELTAANTALTARSYSQDAELAALREESVEHVAAVKQVTADHANRLLQIEVRDKQLAELTAQVATQARTIQSEVERAKGAEEGIGVLESDLRVAEDAINRLESEVRARSMRVEELTRINSQMQGEIGDAKRWLEERDSLMSRLETEAAHSSALVDNIQRSIRSLAPGASGTHEAIRENGARLLVRSQDGHEVVHVLGRKTTIGRTPDNDLQIDASFVSRHHAVLLITGQQTVIEDLNSTNGVLVNGQRISREVLNDGDHVMIGKARFRFVVRPATSRTGAEPAA
jgi:chromosome segregation ATPase